MRSARTVIVVGMAANALAFALAVGWMFWWPLWRHHHPDRVPFDAAVIEAHRSSPDARVLDTVRNVSMLTDHPPEGDDAVQIARHLLAGELRWPYFAPVRMGPEFDPADLERGPPVIRLFAASLVAPEMLLRAHEHTGDPAFLLAASRYIEAFIRYEAALQFPQGYMHNSHVVANRATVLVRYWHAVRDDPGRFPQAGALVHEHASRLAALLSDPAHFIARTNHGVMQSIGLLQLSIAFPQLEGASRWRQLALERFEQQRPFWISPEGMVLEHAAGYHFHGVVLLGHMLRLLEAAGVQAPATLLESFEATKNVLATLQRPDRSLPVYGNTFRYQWSLPRSIGIDAASWSSRLQGRPSASTLWPTAGAAVWWSPPTVGSVGAQAFVAWGRFATHGHRRAQDGSLLLWADGQSWITSSGYWPGDDLEGLLVADGWAGSNALHLLGEDGESSRRTVVKGYGASDRLRFVDLERQTADGARLRRQIVQLDADRWLVLDGHTDPAGRPARVLWTAEPELKLSAVADGAFRLETAAVPTTMQLDVVRGGGATVSVLRGSRDPFGGWVAFDRRAWPASSIDIRLPAPGAWALTRMALDAGAGVAKPLPRLTLRSGEDWTLSLDGMAGPERLSRLGDQLEWSNPKGAGPPIRLSVPPVMPSAEAATRIANARAAVEVEYPRFRTLEEQRAKASLALGALAVLAFAALALVATLRPGLLRMAWIGANVAWVAAAAILLQMLRG